MRERYDIDEIETSLYTRGQEMLVNNIANIDLDYALETYINGFADEEKDAVELVFSTAKVGIAKDFGITISVSKQADEE